MKNLVYREQCFGVTARINLQTRYLRSGFAAVRVYLFIRICLFVKSVIP